MSYILFNKKKCDWHTKCKKCGHLNIFTTKVLTPLDTCLKEIEEHGDTITPKKRQRAYKKGRKALGIHEKPGKLPVKERIIATIKHNLPDISIDLLELPIKQCNRCGDDIVLYKKDGHNGNLHSIVMWLEEPFSLDKYIGDIPLTKAYEYCYNPPGEKYCTTKKFSLIEHFITGNIVKQDSSYKLVLSDLGTRVCNRCDHIRLLYVE